MASSSQPPPPSPPPDPAIPSQPSDIELAMILRALVDPSAAASPPGNTITIHDADVNALDPADLTQHLAATVAKDGQKAWYFSTKLEPKSQQGGKRKRRCMESGVWHDEGKSKPVVGSQARRYLFSFLNKVDGARTGWIMHEFRLPVVPDGDEQSPVVLCKVFRSSRAPDSAMNNESATTELQAAQADVEVVVEEETLGEEQLAAREVAVARREAAVARREAAVARREAAAVARREAAVARRGQTDLLFFYMVLKDLLITVVHGRNPHGMGLAMAIAMAMAEEVVETRAREAEREALLRRDAAELAGEPNLAASEQEAAELVRRNASHLEMLETNLNRDEVGRELEPWEQTRLLEMIEEFETEMEVLMAAIMMMAAREGLCCSCSLPVEHWCL